MGWEGNERVNKFKMANSFIKFICLGNGHQKTFKNIN